MRKIHPPSVEHRVGAGDEARRHLQARRRGRLAVHGDERAVGQLEGDVGGGRAAQDLVDDRGV